jgi:UrcA family protein
MKEMNSTTSGRTLARTIQLVALVTVGAAGLAATGAQAGVDNYEPRTITVKLQDLDLATARGQDALRRRVRRAADIVCGSPDTREMWLLAGYRSCVNNATNGALAQIEFPKS